MKQFKQIKNSKKSLKAFEEFELGHSPPLEERKETDAERRRGKGATFRPKHGVWDFFNIQLLKILNSMCVVFLFFVVLIFLLFFLFFFFVVFSVFSKGFFLS